MLGVLKRRWKPKRFAAGLGLRPNGWYSAANQKFTVHGSVLLTAADLETCELLFISEINNRASNGSRFSSDINPLDSEKPRLAPSVRQVHPVCDEKAQLLAYDNNPSLETHHPKRPSIDLNSSPPPYPKRASLDSNPSPNSYPLAPNICVEAGRIEFIKQSIDGVSEGVATPLTPPKIDERITVTRGLQTDEEEKYDDSKEESLKARIAELEAALEASQKVEQRDKQNLGKLQRQLSRREAAQRDADRERRLRADSEARAKQALQEAARCRSRLRLLTHEFSRMEETVRSMLVYKSKTEQLRQEKAALTVAFESRCQQYQTTITRLNQEISSLRQQLEQVNSDPGIREGVLQAHSIVLHRQAEESRKQYERCLDDVANQVVKALLAQKGLREEITNLHKRIQDLESQNRALTSMLVHQLRGDTSSLSDFDLSASNHLALEDSSCKETSEGNTSADVSPTNLMKTSLTVKHCNSFNSDVLDNSSSESQTDTITHETKLVSRTEKHLSADSRIIDKQLSLEDKKRHQILTRLWTELKGTEVTPKRLLEALSAVDSSLWVPPQRPVSLNLQLPILQAAKYRRSRPILAQASSKSEEETTGNESPESGNRDEGYSTMSSDVQAEVSKASGEGVVASRGLEDLKEATDETEVNETRLLVTDNNDPDILYIPLNLLGLNPRNSYPPTKDILPFQHIMRSFSDSHLCIKITTAPSPCYSLSSPISSSPSILLLDITEKRINPLRRVKAAASLLANTNLDDDQTTTPSSWSSPAEECLKCTALDAEYIQHWLRLDETRSALQQHHRDMLELEYDRAELEDWSLSLSNDDIRNEHRKSDVTTPGQISLSTLPSIQENNTLELEEDSNECLWNNSSYMMDREGHELVALLMDTNDCQIEKQWPYAVHSNPNLNNSPDNSWSSNGSDYCHSYEPETYSKRSSAALSGCSDDTGELPAIGTDFTRDFYRLVKFESTKSLASTSSRSLGGALSENGDREMALQNVLTFIAEQQKYVHSREGKESRPCSVNEVTKEFNVEGPPQHIEDLKICDDRADKSSSLINENENYVTLKQLATEYSLNEQNIKDECANVESHHPNISYAEEVCLVTPLDVESENCSNISERPVDICSSISVELTSTDYSTSLDVQTSDSNAHCMEISDISISETSDLAKSGDTLSSDTPNNNMSESVTSSTSTPDTVVSKIPRFKHAPSKIPVSPNKNLKNNQNNSTQEPSKLPKYKSSKISRPIGAQKQKAVQVQNSQPQPIITSERLPQFSAGVISNIIDGPPHRAVSFHERATSKDVIDELNRMIQKGDDTTVGQERSEDLQDSLDEACRPTGWIHVEKDIDLTDPKARANLLDVMMASVSSDSSPTSSCGGSVTSDSTEETPDYGHLHRIHKFHRQKKVNAARPEHAVVRASMPITRPSIIGRPDFFMRYGEKEKEAVASFDFLDDFSTTSSSFSCSMDENDEKIIENEFVNEDEFKVVESECIRNIDLELQS